MGNQLTFIDNMCCNPDDDLQVEQRDATILKKDNHEEDMVQRTDTLTDIPARQLTMEEAL